MERTTRGILAAALLGLPLLVIVSMVMLAGNSAPARQATSPAAPTTNITLPPPGAEQTRILASGRDVYFAKGCWRCHPLGEEELPGRLDAANVGPDLDQVGQRLSIAALQQSILDPNAVIVEPREKHLVLGKSRMPSFRDSFSEEELRDLILFLHERGQPSQKVQPTVVTDATFLQEVTQVKGLVLVDFWAEWCAPCRQLAPALDEIAVTFAGRVKICKVNIDDNDALVKRFRPIPLPCLILFNNGKEISRKHGVDPELEAKEFFTKWLTAPTGTPATP